MAIMEFAYLKQNVACLFLLSTSVIVLINGKFDFIKNTYYTIECYLKYILHSFDNVNYLLIIRNAISIPCQTQN